MTLAEDLCIPCEAREHLRLHPRLQLLWAGGVRQYPTSVLESLFGHDQGPADASCRLSQTKIALADLMDRDTLLGKPTTAVGRRLSGHPGFSGSVCFGRIARSTGIFSIRRKDVTMKKLLMLFAMASVWLVLAGLTGCQKEEKAGPEAAVEKAAEHPAATQPAAQKPKDHPAH